LSYRYKNITLQISKGPGAEATEEKVWIIQAALENEIFAMALMACLRRCGVNAQLADRNKKQSHWQQTIKGCHGVLYVLSYSFARDPLCSKRLVWAIDAQITQVHLCPGFAAWVPHNNRKNDHRQASGIC